MDGFAVGCGVVGLVCASLATLGGESVPVITWIVCGLSLVLGLIGPL